MFKKHPIISYFVMAYTFNGQPGAWAVDASLTRQILQVAMIVVTAVVLVVASRTQLGRENLLKGIVKD